MLRLGSHVNEILDLRRDKDNSNAFPSFSFLPLPFILSPLPSSPFLPLLSSFLHCSLLPVSLSCPLSLDNRSQFIKGETGTPLVVLYKLLSPRTRSQTMLHVFSSINFDHLKTKQRTRLMLEHSATGHGVCLTMLCLNGL